MEFHAVTAYNKRNIKEIAFYVWIGYDSTYTSGGEKKKISLRFGESLSIEIGFCFHPFEEKIMSF
jgi:hypothetical protein